MGYKSHMEAQKEQIPRQGLPDGGSAVPSEVQPKEGGPAETGLRTNPMTPRRSRKVEAPSSVASIDFALECAAAIVKNPDIDELDWPVLLREQVQNIDTPFSESDLRRYLRQAKLQRDGRKDFKRKEEALSTRETEWIWQGVVMREATNLIFALPKVGKTRLMLAMLSDLFKGRGEFAGTALYPGKERLLLLGPDQSENSWASYLSSVGLCTKEGVLGPSVVAMTSAETMFTLDDYWLTRIEEELRAHGPLVVLLDSYSAAIRALGLDENKSESATPLMKLHNIVHQYKSTLIVIHHANKSGGDGNTARASRGSSAITACVDNLIEMARFKGNEAEGEKKYELRVEGRAETEGTPLIGFSKHSAEWRSYGSVGEARAELRKDESYDGLTQAQLLVLDAVITATKDGNRPVTINSIAEDVHGDATKPMKVMISKQVNRLMDLGFVVEDPNPPKGSHHRTKHYRPTGWAVSKHRIDF